MDITTPTERQAAMVTHTQCKPVVIETMGTRVSLVNNIISLYIYIN